MTEAPNVTTIEVSPAKTLVDEVRYAFEQALADKGKISDDVLNLAGMSGKRYRRFINNLIENFQIHVIWKSVSGKDQRSALLYLETK